MTKTKGLLVMDVDSTLVREEVIDLLGEEAGLGQKIAAITARAMNGQLDFQEALEERVALLKGLPETIFSTILNQIHFNQGAKELVEELHRRHYKVGLVSGGFHETVDHLAKMIGIDYVKANRLEIKNGILTGRLIGDIVTKDVKVAKLQEWAKKNNLSMAQTVAMGDGANDLPMIKRAGIGIAFNAKEIVRQEAPYHIEQPDLYQVIKLIDEVNHEKS